MPSIGATTSLAIHDGLGFNPRHVDMCGVVFVALKLVFLVTSISAYAVWPARGGALGRNSRKSVRHYLQYG